MRVCLHGHLGKTGEQIWGALVLLLGWKGASSVDSSFQCLMEMTGSLLLTVRGGEKAVLRVTSELSAH